MSFQKLDELGHKLEALEHALAILGADEATHMAVGGGEKRADAMASLAGMLHRQASSPEIADWIDSAENEDLNGDRTEQLWRDLRAKNDWSSFRPALEGIVSLVREEAAMRASVLKLDPYDALMEQYDPGNRAAEINPIFEELKTFLKDFVPEALETQAVRDAKRPRKPLSGTYAVDRQRALGLAMMGAVGFDLLARVETTVRSGSWERVHPGGFVDAMAATEMALVTGLTEDGAPWLDMPERLGYAGRPEYVVSY